MTKKEGIYCLWFGQVREEILGSGFKIKGLTSFYSDAGNRLKAECVINSRHVFGLVEKEKVEADYVMEAKNMAQLLISKLW